ncbi:uncharacterized protein LOC119630752 [Bombyx mori]|uniref:uncharacterized protein LOC119630752 n=1 Tax=Bombyx mori TaxID=7091 RepID=UPI002ED15983
MPPRKIRQQTDDNSDSGDEKVDAVPSPAPVLMSGDQLSSLLAAFSKSQAEANRQLVESLWASHGLGSGSKFTTPIVSPSPTPTSNMAKCTARFDGVARDPEAVEAFIDSVEVYKECACVSDDIALRGLPMLMEGEAAIWWRGVRNEVSSWPDALKRLRAMYGVPRPAHKVFRDVFSSEQGDELADSSIVRIRAMLSRLPYQLPEEARLDIIYDLLHKRIRKRLPRDGVSDIETLIEKSRMVEESLVECTAALNIPPQPHKSLPTVLGERSSAPDVTSNNETLLGIDFILKARLIIDFSSMTWRSADQPRDIHPLSCENSRDPISCASINLLREDEGKFLSESEKGRLVDLLGEYTDVFEEVGEPTPFSEHRIDTGDHPPIAVPPYRITPARKEVMRAELDKMLAEDVIEECESAWSAPCVLVPKPNGTYRFCVDYRKLNAVTKTDSYPMPRIDELLQSTNGGCVMSSLDLRSGYWQVQTLDRDKTAFSTPFGTFRFKRMPFGLKNAPATFQRLIDRFRSGSSLQEVAILAYLDDILVISENIDKHFSDLRAVFDRLRVFKLRANRDKCAFAREQVKYLGHVISRSGISPDRDKVSAVLDMKEPTCLRQLRTFLQTCSWFRQFIPNFAKIAEPLTRLTKKSQPWIWGLEQDDAFKSLKRLLTTSPILIQADYTKPFILRTDASDYALGACLLQGESSNDERPIEYASRLLTSAERNYSTTEREALAVVWAVERFRGYIDGHLVHVRSDHQPLKWLFSVKSPSGRLVRWAMKLQAYDLQIEYTPGKVNVIADTLSRPVTELNSPPDCGICPVIVDVPHWDAASTRDAQMADPEISKIITDLEGTDELSVNRWSERGYLLTQGVLYRYAEDSESEEPQLVVPESLRGKVMFECHDSPTAAHGGIQRTIHRISQRFYFPGLRRYVTEYLKTCIECQRYKPSNFKPAGLLQTPVPAQRFEVIAVDLFGPLPKGPCGERWILIVEDTASKWVELFALIDATAEVCAKTLVNEVFMRFGVPRRMISDNGVQFVADVMQKAMFVLGVKQNLIPLYHPEANPVERKNRDLKAHLAILLEGRHQQWPEVLSFVRFAFNSSVCTSTEQTPAYLTFGRELRSPISAQLDLRAVVESENFVPQISPYLSKLAETISTAKENIEHHQDIQKTRADLRRSEPYQFAEGDLVLMKTHVLSNASKGITSKFNPKRDGPYVISKKSQWAVHIVSKNRRTLRQKSSPVATTHQKTQRGSASHKADW